MRLKFPTITRKKIEEILVPRLREIKGDVIIDLGGKHGKYLEESGADLNVNVDIEIMYRPTVVGDVHKLPLQDSSAAVVVATELLEHCQEPWTVVEEIRRILRPGGLCIASTRFLFPIHRDPEDYFRFTDAALKYLFRKFSEVVIVPQGNLVFAIFDLVSPRLPSLMLLAPLVGWLPDAPRTRTPLGYFVEAKK